MYVCKIKTNKLYFTLHNLFTLLPYLFPLIYSLEETYNTHMGHSVDTVKEKIKLNVKISL